MMIQIEIIKGVEDRESNSIRYDVKVEIPGLYVEIIPYICAIADRTDLTQIQQAMDQARAHAKLQAEAALDAWAIARATRLLGLPGRPIPTEDTPKRKRRTKAEIEADAAKEKVEAAPVAEDSSGAEQVPSPALTPNADGTMRLDSEEITQGTPPLETSPELATPSVSENSGVDIPTEGVPPFVAAIADGEPMERRPEHEAILRELLIEAYGPRWMDRPDVKSATVAMATHAIANGVLVRAGDGSAHPQIRALFAELVREKCPEQ
jgi:hypothetical protein